MAIPSEIPAPVWYREGNDDLPENSAVGPATPRGRRHSNADWSFPFPAPGRWQGKKRLAANTERRQPWVDVRAVDPHEIPPRFVRSPISSAELRERIRALGADDVGIVSIDHPALAHEKDEIRYVYPHARSLIVLIGEENKPSMQSRYLPSANHELYECEERLFKWGHEVIRLLKSLGGEGLTTTIGWPQEVSVRWADKIWPLSHKLVAQAAGLGIIGTSRNFLHEKFGAYCLIDTVVTNLELDEAEYAEAARPLDWNPCLECNLCVASCPTEAIKADGEFDFFACYNHTYRDSIPGFLDLVRDLGEAKPKKFEHRWSDAEVASLWQSMAFRVEYRCFNCVATCPAEIHEEFHADKKVRGAYVRETLKPLTYTRSTAEERFVIDTPSARERYDIPPGSYRTEPDVARPGQGGMIRLVQLQRIRVSNVDAMMRMMTYYFRPEEAKGLDFTCQFELSGEGGGHWVLRVCDERCHVAPGDTEKPDLTIRCDGALFLGVHRGEVSAVRALVLGQIKLEGRKELFLTFPRLFPVAPAESIVHRLAWKAKRAWRRWRGKAAAATLAIVLGGAAGSAANAEVPPEGTVIDAANMAKYAEVLFPTAEYFLRHGMTITVAPYRKWEWPKLYREATEKFSAQVRFNADGSNLENYVAGAPFPVVDSNDPQAGAKWIWNHEQNPVYTDNIGMGWNVELVNAKGERERFFASNFWRRMRWRGRLQMDPKPVAPHDPAISYTEQWGPLSDPADLAGAGILNFRYISPDAPDDTYMYLPALRKVRRLSVANRSDSFWGTDIDIDSIWAFNAKIPFWTFRVIAEKQMLHPVHAGGYGEREAWCAQPDGASGIRSFAFCLPWEMRPMVVVEGVPTGYTQYAYAKKIVYIDKEFYAATLSEVYDKGGQIWKAWYMSMDTGKTPTTKTAIEGKPEWAEEKVVATHGGMVDFQLNHVSKWDGPDAYLFPDFGIKHWYVDEAREWNTPENFTVNYLISSGSF